ncbi:MAG: hypothetical protein ACT4P6_09310 [Gemmatimonadaceae bacterium]
MRSTHVPGVGTNDSLATSPNALHMDITHVRVRRKLERRRDMTATIANDSGRTWREGAKLGLTMGTAIWVWLAIVDATFGRPFHSFEVLGGVATFTIAHYTLNVIYGIAIMSAIHGARRTPSLIVAQIFGFVMMEIWFGMLAVMLGQSGIGNLSWLVILGGSLVGLGAALVVLSRRYDLAALLHAAERER